jgi:hypothetical protein
VMFVDWILGVFAGGEWHFDRFLGLSEL